MKPPSRPSPAGRSHGVAVVVEERAFNAAVRNAVVALEAFDFIGQQAHSNSEPTDRVLEREISGLVSLLVVSDFSELGADAGDGILVCHACTLSDTAALQHTFENEGAGAHD